jgi:hypothetical protein
MTVNASILFQRLVASSLPTPAIPKTVKAKAPKKERIDTSFLKARAQLHVREFVDECFPDGGETKGLFKPTDRRHFLKSCCRRWRTRCC